MPQISPMSWPLLMLFSYTMLTILLTNMPIIQDRSKYTSIHFKKTKSSWKW